MPPNPRLQPTWPSARSQGGGRFENDVEWTQVTVTYPNPDQAAEPQAVGRFFLKKKEGECNIFIQIIIIQV